MVLAKETNLNLPYLALDEQFVNPVLSRSAKIVAERALGSYVYDMNGDAYLDFASGIAVTNLGHCHPKVVAAVQKQVAELMHTSVVTYNKRYIELAEKLAKISPGKLDSVFLANSGAEAVEGAIKLARYATGRPALINFRGSFHGRTMMAVALTTSKLYYREKYDPLPGPIYTAKYPYVYRSPFRNEPEKCVEDCFAYLDMLFHHFVHPEQVAAMIIEPIQGEGGYVVPPPGFLEGLRQIAHEHGILFIVDEVQTGFGRTGLMFACEHEKLEPDIMLVAKGIASGLPLSAFIARREITQKWPPGRHGSTFGGNPVSCAAALATLEVIEEEKLLARAEQLGTYIMQELQDFAQDKAYIGEVRGKGLMIGIEFNDIQGDPSQVMAEQVAHKCLERRMLVYTGGINGQVLRLMPPLTLSDEEVEKGLKILKDSMQL